MLHYSQIDEPIKKMQQLSKRNFVVVGLLITAALLLSLPVKTSAAGSAVIGAESSSSVTAGSNITVSFYATPSSANIYSGEFRATLSKLTFVSYSSSGSPFTGLNMVMTGNSAGSTNFTVAFSHIGAVSGSSSKVLIGKAVLKASSSTGTAQVSLSDLVADDNSGDPMSPSASGKTLSVTAPPSDDDDESGGGGGGGTTPTPTNNDSNPIDNPNPDSDVSIPVAPDEKPKTISEDEASIIVTGAESASTTADDLALAKTKGWVLYAVGALGFLVLAGIAIKLFLARQTHVVGVAPAAFSQPPQPPVIPTTTTTSQPPVSDTEPRIIKPTVKEDGSASSSEDTNTPQS